MFALTLTLALLASSASARFMPVHRFTSLEGMAVDSDTDAVARPARHALDFAAFDRPLSADPDPHHRVARDAAEACDCANDADLVGEIVESAPVMEETLDAPVYQQPLKSAPFVESPEELHGIALSADDAELDDDQEATLSEGGLEPLLEAADEAGAGRPARQTAPAADKVAAEEQPRKESEAVQSESQAQAQSEAQAQGQAQAQSAQSQAFPVPEEVPETGATSPAPTPQGERAVEDAPSEAVLAAPLAAPLDAPSDAAEAQQVAPQVLAAPAVQAASA